MEDTDERSSQTNPNESDAEITETSNQIVNSNKSSNSTTSLPFRARNFEVPTESNIPSPKDSKELVYSDSQDSNRTFKSSEIVQESNENLEQSSDRAATLDQTRSAFPSILLRSNENELRNNQAVESDQVVNESKTDSNLIFEKINQEFNQEFNQIDSLNSNKFAEPIPLNEEEEAVDLSSADLIKMKKGKMEGQADTFQDEQQQESNQSDTQSETQSETTEVQSPVSLYKPINGQPIKILEIDPDTKQILFNENELRDVFEKNGALDKLVCVCSIAGDYRKGKSFLLNYTLRFLQNNYEYLNRFVTEASPQWLGHVDEPLTGFSWRSGVDLETTGIWIWSELFPCKVSKNFDIIKTGSSYINSIIRSKEEVAESKRSVSAEEEYEDAFICLLDSQGAFDEKSTVSDCATIFSILFLISSMQIFNVFHQLQEDNLQYLQLFTEYGRLIYEEGIHCKPFQRLTFLVRDWFSPSEFNFGSEGGEEYLTKKFKPDFRRGSDSSKNNASTKVKKLNENPHENLLTRVHIQRCFDKIDCFLLPHPGKYVSSSNNYNGNWGDMQFEFLGKLKEFIEWWFSDLQVKRSTDYLPRRITGGEFVMFFKMLVLKLSEHNNEIIKPITIFESMAKISHMNAVEDCIKQFQAKMNALFGNDRPFVWPNNIDKICSYLEEQYRTNYLKKKKFGNRQFEREFIAKLNEQFKEICSYYQNLNELKCTVLPAYMLIVCIIVLTNILCTMIKIIFPFWIVSNLIQWILSIQLAFLSLAICVEILGLNVGSSFVALMRRRLQCIYHLTRAKSIDLNALNSI